jgi:hypothetical protein
MNFLMAAIGHHTYDYGINSTPIRSITIIYISRKKSQMPKE